MANPDVLKAISYPSSVDSFSICEYVKEADSTKEQENVRKMSIEQEVFDHHYEMTLAYLKDTARKKDFSLEQVKEELRNLLVYQGQDWTGRGQIKSAEIEGTILAYQAFILRQEKVEA